MVNGVANYGKLQNSLGHGGTYSYMVSKYFTVRLICKTKFPDTCHVLNYNAAVKGLSAILY